MGYNFIKITEKESALLELLKLFLLIQVVIGHAIALAFPKIIDLDLNSVSGLSISIFKTFFSFGRESAYMFVFLSGFFTAKIFFNNSNQFNLLEVIKKRIFRIYPVLLTAMILSYFLDFTGMIIFNYPIYQINSFSLDVASSFNYQSFLWNLLSLQPTFFETFGSNTPLWTLGYLVQFYFIAAIIKGIARRSNIYFSIIILITILSCSLINLEFALLLSVWFMGSLIRYFSFKDISLNNLILFGSIIILLIILRFSPKYLSIFLTPILGGLILIFIKKLPQSFFGIRFASFPKLPDISYSLYAVHMPILFLIYGFLVVHFDTSLFTNQLIYVISSFLLSLLVSFIVFKIPEILKEQFKKHYN